LGFVNSLLRYKNYGAAETQSDFVVQKELAKA